MQTVKLNAGETPGYASEAVGKRGRWYRIEEVEVSDTNMSGLVGVEVYSKVRGYTAPVGLMLRPEDAVKLGEAIVEAGKAQMKREKGIQIGS